MYKKILVSNDIEAGKRVLEHLQRLAFPIIAAFWFYFEDADAWRLVIVSPTVEEQGPRYAYTLLGKVLYDLEHDPAAGPYVPMENISILSPNDWVYKQVRSAIQGPTAGQRIVQGTTPRMLVEDTYVYTIA